MNRLPCAGSYILPVFLLEYAHHFSATILIQVNYCIYLFAWILLKSDNKIVRFLILYSFERILAYKLLKFVLAPDEGCALKLQFFRQTFLYPRLKRGNIGGRRVKYHVPARNDRMYVLEAAILEEPFKSFAPHIGIHGHDSPQERHISHGDHSTRMKHVANSGVR